MNSVILIGNLTKDPEVRYVGETGTAMGRFAIAVNDGYGEKKRTSFINIITFGKTAENCERFLEKGKKCCVRGKIQTGSYEGKNGTVYTTDVVADEVEFLSSGEPKGFTKMTDEDIPW